jgi:hypothetical protein
VVVVSTGGGSMMMLMSEFTGGVSTQVFTIDPVVPRTDVQVSVYTTAAMLESNPPDVHGPAGFPEAVAWPRMTPFLDTVLS